MAEKSGEVLTIEELAAYLKIDASQACPRRQNPIPKDRPSLAFPKNSHRPLAGRNIKNFSFGG